MPDLFYAFSYILFLIDSVLVPLIFAIAFIVFIWGVYTYFIAGAGDSEKRETGRTYILYGLIGLFVMISVWGLVRILVGTFGFDRQIRPDLPQLGGFGGGPGYSTPQGEDGSWLRADDNGVPAGAPLGPQSGPQPEPEELGPLY